MMHIFIAKRKINPVWIKLARVSGFITVEEIVFLEGTFSNLSTLVLKTSFTIIIALDQSHITDLSGTGPKLLIFLGLVPDY